MRRIVIRQARPGMLLARAVPDPRRPGTPLVHAGVTLTVPHIARLHEHGAFDLWILYPGLEFIDDLLTPGLSCHQRRFCESLGDSFYHFAAGNPAVPLYKLRPVIEELVSSIFGNSGLQPILSALASVDAGLLRHSTDVCILGLLLGLRLEDYIIEQRRRLTTREARDLVNLGLGCLLHDVGELQLPEARRESRHCLALDPNADNDWKQHAELAFGALRGLVEPSAANTVLHHHQHFDGSGFTTGERGGTQLAGQAIHIFPRIAMAADTFAHVLHSAPGGIAQPAVRSLWQIQQAPYRNWFDPVILNALLAIIQPFTPGMVVTLSDGRQAIVSRTQDQPACYPEVQVLRQGEELLQASIAPEIITLSRAANACIQEVDGSPVEDCLFGPSNVPTQIPALQRMSA